MERRTRSASRTRASILAAARTQFAEAGYAATTTRSIAAAAGTDAALVSRYFGSKSALFAEAVRSELRYPELDDIHGDGARILVEAYFESFDSNGQLLALMRTAASDPEAARLMRETLVEQGVPALGRLAVDRPAERAGLVGSLLVGFAFNRWVLGVPALDAMTRAEAIAWLGPLIVTILTDPNVPGAVPEA